MVVVIFSWAAQFELGLSVFTLVFQFVCANPGHLGDSGHLSLCCVWSRLHLVSPAHRRRCHCRTLCIVPLLLESQHGPENTRHVSTAMFCVRGRASPEGMPFSWKESNQTFRSDLETNSCLLRSGTSYGVKTLSSIFTHQRWLRLNSVTSQKNAGLYYQTRIWVNEHFRFTFITFNVKS